VAVLAEVAV
jgi:hypothetical protein